ncbi:putative mitochondrial hypothetical protein [Leptomonas pyrrhocoris]|uniref:Pentacotripeptide-repeat region of PRORP domain-containing protein n=1 Tax=Leptomonas pyrrhocoris TaxID=157538 RepID=A0A0N0VEK0_LEPPY|nr:putative mitochondrial hypothetical protein [Leptomonas pyrrhocoris]XP_015657017.1 putative mitochondrial hypothetical protein [Leptomonas pyrrhocoris]KPA78572.1 putative mitochondrial hypothetical protein [Leptomonas pyrrhocoris]KPA78578.1 putative mitochondrial hypothetical protein [Leptomonas pyrrhocoris]|eukprot:XP_015657011.1 putative mitochondrial hypothetical protein [Leptomonas pyrrhocoris]
MSHPYSARAYRVRLQHGNFSSLRELTRAPYAPSPLNVLVDLLRLSVVPPANAEGSASSSKAGVHHALERALDVQWVLHATMAEARDTVLAAETVGDAASHAALQELWSQVDFFSNAIEDGVRGAPGDAPGLAADTDTTFAFPLLDGDEPPQQGAHGKYGSEANSPSTAEGEAADTTPTRWVLPTATYAILLRGVLQLAAITGAHLHAFSALNELIALHERRQRSLSIHPAEAEGEVDDSFSMDDALALVDAAAQRHVDPLTAQDHLYAMEACAHERHRDFRTTLSLYRRFVQHVTAGWFAATPADFTAALVAVAHSSRTTTEFTELRALLVESEAAAAVPVSVPLYTALIDAASRAAEEPQRMSIALSLYRRLRDGALTPTSDTYAALIACCASTRAPTQAFAFYHEARQVCGVANFTPRVYTNLLLSYSTAGYGADARKTLDVLVEAGAPLSRASFHAVLASAVTVREAQEIMELMTQRYDITPTPHTYAYVMQAVAKAPAGSRTALQLFDVHEDALRALARLSASVDREGGGHSSFEGIGEAFALSTSADGVALEPTLLAQYPLYVRALEHALLRLRVDPTQDPRLKAYLTPLVRVAQQRMNAFTGMPPQAPIRVPEKERLCIAVLAADVLANVDEWVMPFMSHYSVLVIPYSAVLALQKGGGRRVEGAMAKGPSAGLFDPVWRETPGGGEHDALVEHRRRRLLRFLADHRDVVHLVSLEEELAWSRETRRYGVGITDLFARAAAVALHLARLPEEDGTSMTSPDTSSVYARHPAASIVLVSANYEKCGKYVVALKQAKGGDGSTAGLQAALRRVSYHNPRTNPNWVPPSLSITHQQQQRQKARGDVTKKQAEAPTTADVAKDVAAEAVAVRADAAAELYQSLLDPVKSTHHPMMGTDAGVSIEDGTSGDEHTRSHDTALSASSRGSAAKRRGAEEEGAMDAALLMSLLND